jgi:hypothetical protein
MSIFDRIRELLGGKQSGADSTAVIGGSVAATSHDDDVDAQAGSESFSAGDSSGGGGDSGGSGGSGDGGGGGTG